MSNETNGVGDVSQTKPKKMRIFKEKKNFRTLLTKLNLVAHYLKSDWDLEKVAKVADVKKMTLRKWVVTYSPILIKMGVVKTPTKEKIAELPEKVQRRVDGTNCMWSPLPDGWTWEKTFEAADKFMYGDLEVYRDLCDHYDGINKDSSGLLVQLRRIYNACSTGELVLYSMSEDRHEIIRSKEPPIEVIYGSLELSKEDLTSYHMGKVRPKNKTIKWDMFADQIAENEAFIDELLDTSKTPAPVKVSPIAKAAQRSRTLRVAPYNKEVGIEELLQMQKGYKRKSKNKQKHQPLPSPIHDEFVASLANAEELEAPLKELEQRNDQMKVERDTIQAELVKEVNLRKEIEAKYEFLKEERKAEMASVAGLKKRLNELNRARGAYLDERGELQGEIEALKVQQSELKERLDLANIKIDTLQDLKGDKGLADENRKLRNNLQDLRALFSEILGSSVSIHQILYPKE